MKPLFVIFTVIFLLSPWLALAWQPPEPRRVDSADTYQEMSTRGVKLQRSDDRIQICYSGPDLHESYGHSWVKLILRDPAESSVVLRADFQLFSLQNGQGAESNLDALLASSIEYSPASHMDLNIEIGLLDKDTMVLLLEFDIHLKDLIRLDDQGEIDLSVGARRQAKLEVRGDEVPFKIDVDSMARFRELADQGVHPYLHRQASGDGLGFLVEQLPPACQRVGLSYLLQKADTQEDLIRLDFVPYAIGSRQYPDAICIFPCLVFYDNSSADLTVEARLLNEQSIIVEYHLDTKALREFDPLRPRALWRDRPREFIPTLLTGTTGIP